MLAKLKILTSGIRTGIVGIEGGPNDRLNQHEPVGELRDIKSTKWMTLTNRKSEVINFWEPNLSNT